jgi:hypothetical protein
MAMKAQGEGNGKLCFLEETDQAPRGKVAD